MPHIHIVLLLALLASTTATSTTAPQQSYSDNVTHAVSYLVSHFNSTVGLIYESEDQGIHWLERTEYPNYHWRYNQTYWLYSDNLFAMLALEPWRLDISARINQTLQQYNPPFSNKFEAVEGIPTGPDRSPTDVIVNSSSSFVVLYRIHNGTISSDQDLFADVIVYRALSEHYLGEQELATQDMEKAIDMWNGTCVVDYGIFQPALNPKNAPDDTHFCSNMKAALILYGMEVVEVLGHHDKFLQLQEHLWNSQNALGGIVSLTNGHGDPIGSANAETTALTLLAYNSQLISQLQAETTYHLQTSSSIINRSWKGV